MSETTHASNAEDNLIRPVSMIIDGRKIASAHTFVVVDPATGRPFAQCPLAEDHVVDEAVAAARSAFPAWSALAIEERARLLDRFADAMEERKPELAQLLSREQGKPAHSAALGELGGAISWIRATAKMRPQVEVLKDDETGRVELRRKPLGVVASITPWNFPLMIGIWHIAPALLAGNTVVLKPSSGTPLSTLLMVEIANRTSACWRAQQRRPDREGSARSWRGIPASTRSFSPARHPPAATS